MTSLAGKMQALKKRLADPTDARARNQLTALAADLPDLVVALEEARDALAAADTSHADEVRMQIHALLSSIAARMEE